MMRYRWHLENTGNFTVKLSLFDSASGQLLSSYTDVTNGIVPFRMPPDSDDLLTALAGHELISPPSSTWRPSQGAGWIVAFVVFLGWLAWLKGKP